MVKLFNLNGTPNMVKKTVSSFLEEWRLVKGSYFSSWNLLPQLLAENSEQ